LKFYFLLAKLIGVEFTPSHNMEEIERARRAIVYLTVEWSEPVRRSRGIFEALCAKLPKTGLEKIEVFVLDEDSPATLAWLREKSLLVAPVPVGSGKIFWLEYGKLIAEEPVPFNSGIQEIVKKTRALWNLAD